jgi:hypothetical protein
MFRKIPQFRARWHGAVIAWVMLALLSAPSLARDKEPLHGDVPPPPPEPYPVEVEVPRGPAGWITLSAYSLTSPIIRYRIKRQPAAGQLGVPQIATEDTAVVKYTPPAGHGPGEDSFVYAVQSKAGVSAPADVHIKITDKDPLLTAPNEIDFGEVLPGESSRRMLELQNIGGGLAEGTVRAPAGWAIEGNAEYRLEGGGKQKFTLVFKPLEQRAYTGDVQYTGAAGLATDLDGKGVGPVAVDPGPVELKEAGNVRMGIIHVKNRTPTARVLRVTPGPGLEADASVNVPPNDVAEISVSEKGRGNSEIDDHVMIEGENIKADVRVHAAGARPPAAPPLPAASGMLAEPGSVAIATPPAQVEPAPDGPGNNADLTLGTLPPLAPDLGNVAALQIPMPTLEVERVSQTDARVTCDFRGAEPARSYHLEEERVVLDPHGKAVATWPLFKNARVAANGQNVSADLIQLRPSAHYVVRLVGVDDQGGVVAMSGPAEVWTARAPKRSYWGWVVGGLVILAGVGVRRQMKRRPY